MRWRVFYKSLKCRFYDQLIEVEEGGRRVYGWVASILSYDGGTGLLCAHHKSQKSLYINQPPLVLTEQIRHVFFRLTGLSHLLHLSQELQLRDERWSQNLLQLLPLYLLPGIRQ